MRMRISAGVLTIAVAMMWLTTNTAGQQAGAASTAKPAATTAKPAAPATAKPAAPGTTKAYKAPRTPDGHPDLGGFWSNANLRRRPFRLLDDHAIVSGP